MPTMKDVIPADLHGREYIKPWLDKPHDSATLGEFFKKHDELETLLGKRPALPTKDSKPDELEKFFDTLRADKAEDYGIKVDEGAKVDPGFIKAVQRAFLAGKINRRQAELFMDDFRGSMKTYADEQNKTAAAAKAKADKEFEEVAKTALGEGNKTVMERVRKAMAENAPAVYKPLIGKLSNENLVIMAGVINAIMEKYMPADDLNPHTDTNGEGSTESEREEIKKLMTTKEFSDPFNPKYKETRAKVSEFYKKLTAGKK